MNIINFNRLSIFTGVIAMVFATTSTHADLDTDNESSSTASQPVSSDMQPAPLDIVSPTDPTIDSVDGTGLNVVTGPTTDSVDGTGLDRASAPGTESVDGTGGPLNAQDVDMAASGQDLLTVPASLQTSDCVELADTATAASDSNCAPEEESTD